METNYLLNAPQLNSGWLNPSPSSAGKTALGLLDRGHPELGESQEHYHRRTGRGFFLGSAPLHPPAQSMERFGQETNQGYARRLRALADQLDPPAR